MLKTKDEITSANLNHLDYDPVTAEVVQMRLVNIVGEMATTLKRTSGSPILTEAQDFCTAIFDDKNEHIAFSGYVITHIGSSVEGVKSITNYYDLDSIRPGDHFIVNDPHTAGALHQGDVAIISPLFYNDEFIGWAFSNAHIADIGGMSPGGWAPVARDLYSEALRFIPTRIVNEGKYNYELFNLIRSNVRLPEPVVNDIKSLIAANNVSQRRVSELIDQIGMEEYRKYCDINKALSEKTMRDKISKIPNGVFKTEDWVEYDGHGDNKLVRVGCTLTVNDTSLHFDFSDTDPQLDAFINAGKGVMLGIVHGLMMIGLAYDIPINAGILRPIDIELGQPGTVVNPTIPAPVSCGHMEGGLAAGRALWEGMVQALQRSEYQSIRERTAALSHYSWPGNSWVGLDKAGNYTAFAVLDCGSGGLGGQSIGDGLDISCHEVMLGNSIPDVEINEGLYPMLYLWRNLNYGSGGHGFNRGGQGIDIAWVPYGTEELSGTLENAMAEVPTRGVLGGYPGATNLYKVYRGAGALSLISEKNRMPELQEIGSEELLPNHATNIKLSENDVFRQVTGGGGGYGDPLFREINKVVKDVVDGYISVETAKTVYGVLFSSKDQADVEGSKALRSKILSERIGKPVSYSEKTHTHFGLNLQDHALTCACCHEPISSSNDDWRDMVVKKEFNLSDRLNTIHTEIQERKEADLMLDEFYCPSCGALIETAIRKKA
ncbi:hydantoinase B/oxoprolinase family protein [Neobacillus bataviensis]|uniref:hydantoinase B/oxoprolinase family protein n=1 Tax=Neobacillus bataviensis TaxID=220685 RepID=UPI001CBE3D0B|nr:hydantoinase B/oxoprolinase family protein [Neobacillus bataviensis]